MMRTTIIISTVILLFSAGLKASEFSSAVEESNRIEKSFQDSTALNRFTLNDYLKYGALHNPGLKASFYEWKKELENASGAGKLNDPMFNISYFIENVETRVGPQEFKLGLMQKFPWFGKLGNKRDIVFYRSQAAYSKFNEYKQNLFYKISSAYADYYFSGRKEKILKDNFELLKLWESTIESAYQSGKKSQSDLIRVQIELGKMERDLKLLTEKLNYDENKLKNLIHLDDSQSIPVPESLIVDDITVNTDSLRTVLTSNNYTLSAARQIMSTQKAAYDYAKSQSYPDFTLGVSYIGTGQALDPAMLDSGKDPIAVSVEFNLPFLWGKSGASKKAAAAAYKQAEYSYQDKEIQLNTLLDELIYRYRDALSSKRLYRDGLIVKGEQALETGYASYQSGQLEFSGLLDIQRELLKFELEYEKALTNQKKSEAEINYLTAEF